MNKLFNLQLLELPFGVFYILVLPLLQYICHYQVQRADRNGHK